METFYALLALCVGNSPVTDDFPPQRPVTRSFDVLFHLRHHTFKQEEMTNISKSRFMNENDYIMIFHIWSNWW